MDAGKELAFGVGQLKFDLDIYSGQLRDIVRHTFSDRWALSYGVDLALAKYDLFIRFPRPPKEGEPPIEVKRAIGIRSAAVSWAR